MPKRFGNHRSEVTLEAELTEMCRRIDELLERMAKLEMTVAALQAAATAEGG